MRPGSFAAAALGVMGTLVASCTPSPRPAPAHTDNSKSAPLRAARPSEEPWTFGDARGRVLASPSYRVFTTIAPGMVSDRLSGFAEHALARYRTAFGPLPPPGHPLDTYILANRPQWSRAAAQLMGQSGAAYQQIVRGGLTVNGRSILYDIGPRDTFSLLAHEGWHQFTQSTFREPLPLWLEEGIAAVMEGFRWRPGEGAVPEFLTWCNLERFDHLREAADRGALRPLPDILSGSPADSLEGGTDPALTYYAQAWALTLFLMEGDGGRRRGGLEALIADSQRGVAGRRIAGAAAGRAPAGKSRWYGVEAYRVYVGLTPEQDAPAYRDFCLSVVVPGSREAVSIGRSPLSVGK